MRTYCTYFDSNYLAQGIALWQSLQSSGGEFTLYVLCLDEAVFDIITRINAPSLKPIALSEFESGDEALASVKPLRSRIEYIFTCSPSWILWLLKNRPELEEVTYLDADLFFFASPEPLFAEIGKADSAILPHRFPAHLKHLEEFGVYNVSWLTFRRTAAGMGVLGWWRERCLEWCKDVAEDGKFADQKYLDSWPQRFGTHVLTHRGAGVAPWNWSVAPIDQRGQKILVGGDELIFYHYQGLKIFSSWLYDPACEGRGYGEMPFRIRRLIYAPYIKALKQAAAAIRAVQPDFEIIPTSWRTPKYSRREWRAKVLGGRLLFTRGLR